MHMSNHASTAASPEIVVVLLSGGMDSVTALHHAARSWRVVGALSFDYGAKHNHREIPCARWQCAQLGIRHEVVALDFINRLFRSDLLQSGGSVPDGHYAEASMKQTVVPFRNGILLAVAAGFAESVEAQGVVIAAHAGDHHIYPDCREAFMVAMDQAMTLGTYPGIRLLRPFIALSKAQIVTRGRDCGVDFAHTWSCYKGGELHCGSCGTCVERREAFQLAGVPDPTAYAATPPLPAGPAAA